MWADKKETTVSAALRVKSTVLFAMSAKAQLDCNNKLPLSLVTFAFLIMKIRGIELIASHRKFSGSYLTIKFLLHVSCQCFASPSKKKLSQSSEIQSAWVFSNPGNQFKIMKYKRTVLDQECLKASHAWRM